jgi:hypothetical protein
LLALLACAATPRPAHAATVDPADTGPWALFGRETVPSEPPAHDTASVELGVRFSVAEPPVGDYKVTAVRFYRADSEPMVEDRVFVYDQDGRQVAKGVFIGEGGPTGVVDVQLQEPLTLRPGETYTASYVAPDGGYSYQYGAFDDPIEVGPITFPRDAGVFSYDGRVPSDSYAGSSYYVTPVVELDTGSPTPTPVPPRDDTIPSVTILQPSDQATVAADTPFYVRASLADEGGVLREARLVIDGSIVETVPNPWPGSTVYFPATLPAGPHAIEVQAEDPAGNVGDATVTVTAAGATG